MQKLCRQAGANDKRTKVECIIRLREKMNNRKVHDKAFSKIWGASGLLF